MLHSFTSDRKGYTSSCCMFKVKDVTTINHLHFVKEGKHCLSALRCLINRTGTTNTRMLTRSYIGFWTLVIFVSVSNSIFQWWCLYVIYMQMWPIICCVNWHGTWNAIGNWFIVRIVVVNLFCDWIFWVPSHMLDLINMYPHIYGANT